MEACKTKKKVAVCLCQRIYILRIFYSILHHSFCSISFDIQFILCIASSIPPPKAQQFLYLSEVVSDSIALGIVAFAISVSMAKILAKKHDYDIDPNQVSSAFLSRPKSGTFFPFCFSSCLFFTSFRYFLPCPHLRMLPFFLFFFVFVLLFLLFLLSFLAFILSVPLFFLLSIFFCFPPFLSLYTFLYLYLPYGVHPFCTFCVTM